MTTSNGKVRQGTVEWFETVGALMCEAAARSGLPPTLNVSLVERYTDGIELTDGMVQGIRFDIVNGEPSFRIGAGPDEKGDVTVEVSARAAKELNLLRSADPAYQARLDKALATGEMHVDGDPAALGGWLANMHDPIVDITC